MKRSEQLSKAAVHMLEDHPLEHPRRAMWSTMAMLMSQFAQAAVYEEKENMPPSNGLLGLAVETAIAYEEARK